jgi:cystathionine beta-lyase
MVLCSPHNPVGRVWERDELLELGELCIKHGITVVSDEIHSDLVFDGYKHIPFASICEDFAQNSFTCTAPSKTFNLAGLQVSNMIIPNERLRNAFQVELDNNGISGPNAFGIVAAEAAYNHGWDWLEQLMAYLRGNLEFLMEFTRENMPRVKVIEPQGTYLVWMDFRDLGLDEQELSRLILRNAKVAVDDGFIFGHGGEGFVRLNIACPRVLLKDGLERIARELAKM